MLTLNFIIWRRDVAARRLVKARRGVPTRRRLNVLEQRVERWTRLMLVQQKRLAGDDKE